jgi:predicted AAA+ superfamily ATPase
MWLNDSGLIHRADAVQTVRHPLAHYADSSCFKVYALDVGLLGAMAGTPVDLLVHGERLFNEYEGAFVESYVAQQLVLHFGQPLYYWRNKGGKGELDFLCEFAGKTILWRLRQALIQKARA